MTQLDRSSQSQRSTRGSGAPDHGSRRFNVAVLIENEVTGRAARRMVDLYQVKNAPLRYHLVRPLNPGAGQAKASREQAEQLLQKSLERLQALQADVTGAISDQDALDALSSVVDSTQSQEVIVVTGRHRLAELLHRDLASQARSRVDLPLVHLVEQ